MAGSMFFVKTVTGATKPSWFARLLVWTLPVMFAGIASMALLQSFIWLQSAEEVVGTVVRVDAENLAPAGEPERIYYGPVFSFEAADGTLAETQLALFGPDFNYEIGSIHQIMVDPTLETNARLPGFAFNYFVGIIAMMVATGFLVLSTLLWLWIRSIGRKQAAKASNK